MALPKHFHSTQKKYIYIYNNNKNWCFYPHRSRESVSPVCGIVFFFICLKRSHIGCLNSKRLCGLGRNLYLTVFPKLSRNTHNITSIWIIMIIMPLLVSLSFTIYFLSMNMLIMYLYYDERWDIRWNIAWARGKSRGRSPRDFPRAQAIFHRISRLES